MEENQENLDEELASKILEDMEQRKMEEAEETNEQQEFINNPYDAYHDNVIFFMEKITTNQNTIIENQEKVIEQNDKVIVGIHVIIFFIGLFFIYNLLRNMIIVK